MIIRNGIAVGDTRVFKLSSGEEFIASVSDIVGDIIYIRDAYRVVNTGGGPAIIPYSIIGRKDAEMPIMPSGLITYYPLDMDIEPLYIKAKTGLELPR